MTGAMAANIICLTKKENNDDEVDAITIRKYDENQSNKKRNNLPVFF